jgi:hypothetical protein
MLTEPVDYDLDTHPITAVAGVMEMGPVFLACNCTSNAGFYAAQSLQKAAAEQSKCGLRSSARPSIVQAV